MKVDLLTKKNCPLCLEAERILVELREELDLDLSVIDAEADSFLFARHRYDLPVIRLDGRVISRRTGDPQEIARRLRHARRMKDGRRVDRIVEQDPGRKVVQVNIGDVAQAHAFRNAPTPHRPTSSPTQTASPTDGRQVVHVSLAEVAGTAAPHATAPHARRREEEEAPQKQRGKKLSPLPALDADATTLQVDGFPGPGIKRDVEVTPGVEVLGVGTITGLVAVRGSQEAVALAKERLGAKAEATKPTLPLLLAVATLALGVASAWLGKGGALGPLPWIALAATLPLSLLVREARWMIRDLPLVGILPYLAAGLFLAQAPGGGGDRPFWWAAAPVAIHLAALALLIWVRGRIRAQLQVDLPPAPAKVGASIAVEAGAVVPADGRLLTATVLDERALGGDEDVPRQPGEEVFAGSIAVEEMELVVLSPKARRTQTYEYTERALATASTTDRPWIPTVAIPGVAILGAVAAWFLHGPMAAATVLAGVSPLAVALSPSLAKAVGLTAALGRGVGATAASLYRAGMIRSVVLGKRAVLERGVPAFLGVRARQSHSPEELLRLAMAAEAGLDHPIARSIAAYGEELEVEAPRASEQEQIPGAGVEAKVDGKTILLGSSAFLMEREVDPAALLPIGQEIGTRGSTPVYLAVEGEAAGVLEIGAFPSESARQAVGSLELDEFDVRVATGDHRSTVKWLAQALGLPPASAEGDLGAEQKRGLLERLDRPILVASGAEGIRNVRDEADLTLEAASSPGGASSEAPALLIRPDSRGVPAFLRTGRATRRAVRLSTAVALGGLALAIALPLLGAMGPAGATALAFVTTLGSLSASTSPWVASR